MNEDKIIAKLEGHDVLLDKLIHKSLEHDEKLAQMMAKDDFEIFVRQQTVANEEMVTILKRLDEERPFSYSWIRRVEEEVEAMKVTADRPERDLQRVKKELHIV